MLHGQRLAELAQVAVVAAFVQIGGNGGLRGRGGGQAGGELVAHDLPRIASTRHPAHAVTRRQRLRKRRAVHHDAFLVEGLGRARPVFAEIQLAVDVVFNQRNVMPGQQPDQRFLLSVGHQAA
ncbi:hypothetical protein D3C87_1591970 [compost metagenome]